MPEGVNVTKDYKEKGYIRVLLKRLYIAPCGNYTLISNLSSYNIRVTSKPQ